mmetsp:Transcript_8396/g.18026  ORF Transcript_8396/g.18026 Transcript_8396/m.18026 type:complete len:145 (-) Transcript_8396:8-442(-)
MNIASFLADLLHSIEIIQPHSIKQKISFKARGIALVAETNRFQVSELDKRSLVIAAVTAKYMAAMPAVMLPHHHGKISIAILAPENSLILHPTRTFLALLRLLKPPQRSAANSKNFHFDSREGFSWTRLFPGCNGFGSSKPCKW